MSKPKTPVKYEFDIEQNSGYGWDVVDCQDTYKLALEAKKVYDKEMPHCRHRIKRVKAMLTCHKISL